MLFSPTWSLDGEGAERRPAEEILTERTSEEKSVRAENTKLSM